MNSTILFFSIYLVVFLVVFIGFPISFTLREKKRKGVVNYEDLATVTLVLSVLWPLALICLIFLAIWKIPQDISYITMRIAEKEKEIKNDRTTDEN